MTRSEKAIIGNFGKPPLGWKHSVTPNKPTPPDTSALSVEDSQRFQLYFAARESGSLMGFEQINMSPPLADMVSQYENYFLSADYNAWVFTDIASRDWQWRLHQVDVTESVHLKGTVPPATDPAGIGTAAPAVGEVINSTPEDTLAPEYISTGGGSPEVVFGDDGVMVMVKQPASVQ